MILICHHLEPYWEEGYNKSGTHFEDQQFKVANYITKMRKSARPEKVIVTHFSQQPHIYEYFHLHPHIDEFKEYGYSWSYLNFIHNPEFFDVDLGKEIDTKGYFEWDNCKVIRGGYHSQLLLVPKWLQDLKNKQVRLCGAFDGECIEDMEIVLKYVGAKYKRLNHLIV